MICIILYVCVYISCHFIGDPQLTNSNIKLLQCYSTFLTSLKSVQNSILVKFGKKRITQEPVHRFASQINLLIPIQEESPPEVICENTLV